MSRVIIADDAEILTGWKEISRALGMPERTLKRLESAGLPIKREPGKGRGYVRAIRSELQAWKRQYFFGT